MVVLGLVVVVVWVLMIVSEGAQFDDYMSVYECGFDPGWGARFMFSYRFFVLAMMFIIFDVEISLLLPVPYVGSLWGGFVAGFVSVLLGGTLYEVLLGSMEWV